MKEVAIGIDLGGTFIKFGLVSKTGEVMYEGIMGSDAHSSAENVINNLISAIKNCQAFAFERALTVLGVGIGSPGIIDKTYRIVLGGADNIEGWFNLNLADKIEPEVNLPVLLNNDANLMGLGEQAFGAACDCSDVVFITVGTGIGGAVVIDGKLFGGYDNRGTELGHIPLFAGGIPCSCGSVGCLEAYASTTALANMFGEKCQSAGIKFQEEINGKLIIRLYHEKHPLAVEAFNEHVDYLGHGIAGLVNIFSPQRVVIGGGISEAGDFYIAQVNDAFRKYVMPDCALNTSICAAALGNRAGMLGAARWVFMKIV
ncbi:MAG: ROK family protein [Paludibacter sp.]|nr:ROK family protein [Paludibacter sp.]MDD4198747.1 ROK family protein [Paludibacter sp.]MDD4427734.1 ROK family protein [Paludibacter sp.]